MKAGHAGPKTVDKQHSDMQIKTTYKIHTYKNMIIFNHGGHSGKQDTQSNFEQLFLVQAIITVVTKTN